ncbi:H-2 class I histocompatibility antigen, alpha chain-like isoform X4 [Bubalus kerabau]|uniref:H-2 class I histocompatibility antigen, alpha chain-like isoform X4 n=1 Tax=Bubalus carabanensis TaxID=3119969 RepID=UPI00244EF021|nr:H-2 class I histocompatibility antigen, alpha chain-like isoform X4 [Bubalus carabanensis]
MVAPSAAQRELSAHPPGTREGTRPELAQLKADPPGTGALGRCVRLATVWLRSSGSARHPRPPPPPPPPPPLLRPLLLLSGLVLKGAAESPWGLPLVADGPASMAKVVMAELANLKLENKSWPRGMHSTHRMFGCEIQEDGHSNSFWQFGYDGQDHVSLDMETLSWVSANPVALLTKRRMETEHCYAEYNKAYLEGPCLASLRRYLELGGQRFTRREPPTVRVTKHSAQDGGTTLRCWALGFYPQDISLSWWLGEKKLNSKLEYVEARPSGDGTYQMWMAVWVPAGDETQYTCHVQHCSLNHTLTVSWEMPSHPGLMAMVISLILILLVIGGGVSLTKCLQARNKEPYKQPPGDCD